MSTTIESLEIEILSNSNGAEIGIKRLAESLEKLRTATKGGIGLTSVAKQIQSVSDATNNIQSGSVVKLNGLARAISLLGGVKISSSISTQLTSISTAINGATIDGSASAKMQELVKALEPLSQLPKSNLSSTVTALKNIPKTIEKLNGVDMGAFANKIIEVTNAIKPLATEMEKVAAGFSSFPTRIQKLITSNNRLVTSNKSLTASNKTILNSFTDLYHKGQLLINTLSRIVKVIYGFIESSSDYVEDMNLFNVAMGDYAEEAKNYAERVSEIMGIDPGEWMRNQGLFQTLITGFGVAGDKAKEMSESLTELSYDLSSFYNIDVETAMQKLKSGMAGELEPLRAIGYDLSQAKLEATAAELGIDKAVSSMTQAEKAMLRYYAIINQVPASHGDMARTLEDPANQLRILKAQLTMLGREIGNVFMPLLKAVLPYLIAGTKVLREIVSSIALLVGFEPTELEDTGVNNLASGAEDASSALGEASEEAKKLKSYMLGFDELNVINPNSGESSDTALGAFDIEIPSYDFLGELTTGVIDELVEKMKEWLGITGEIDEWSDLLETKLGRILTSVGLVAAGLLAWKLLPAFIEQLDTLSMVAGAVILIDNILVTFQEGLSWETILGGALGGALIGAGLGWKLGGFKGAIGGIIIGVGVSLIINGVTSMLAEGVTVENAVTLITGVLATAGGIITVIKMFNKAHKSPVKDFNTATDTISDVSTGTSKLTTTLKNLAKNLGLGLLIIVEVAAAAVIITGTIWLLGKELEQVGIAWKPVIENADTVAIAMGIGIGFLAAIGVVTALLGSVGASLVGFMALGVAILAEIGVAAALFIVEVALIGVLLEQVGIAWEPVLDNGENIATAIGLGTALLLGIGLVAALLGVATVATYGLLPIAIGLGTLMLIELTVAFLLFTDNLVVVANKLKEDLAPALAEVSGVLPGLTKDMETFTGFMADFAGEIVAYSISSVIAGIGTTIDKVVDFFAGDPIAYMATEVKSQSTQFDDLIEELEDAIPKILEAARLQKEYNEAMNEYAKQQTSGVFSGISGFFQGIGEGISSLFGRSVSAPTTTVSVAAIPTYATGGFPETGQAFIARENGIPEMVGTIGSRTAVANNDQIVESISVGVADANSEQNALLREQNSLLRALLEKDSGVYLDGRALSDSVDKYKREQGRELIVGGAL